jgi:hypothetical protein
MEMRLLAGEEDKLKQLIAPEKVCGSGQLMILRV